MPLAINRRAQCACPACGKIVDAVDHGPTGTSAINYYPTLHMAAGVACPGTEERVSAIWFRSEATR